MPDGWVGVVPSGSPRSLTVRLHVANQPYGGLVFVTKVGGWVDRWVALTRCLAACREPAPLTLLCWLWAFWASPASPVTSIPYLVPSPPFHPPCRLWAFWAAPASPVTSIPYLVPSPPPHPPLQAVGILGCIRFTCCYYLLLLTKKTFMGSICGACDMQAVQWGGGKGGPTTEGE